MARGLNEFSDNGVFPVEDALACQVQMLNVCIAIERLERRGGTQFGFNVNERMDASVRESKGVLRELKGLEEFGCVEKSVIELARQKMANAIGEAEVDIRDAKPVVLEGEIRNRFPLGELPPKRNARNPNLIIGDLQDKVIDIRNTIEMSLRAGIRSQGGTEPEDIFKRP